MIDGNYEALNDEALAAKEYPDPPVAVLRNGVHILREDDSKEMIRQAIREGKVIQRSGHDARVEEFILAESALWHEELARRARETKPR